MCAAQKLQYNYQGRCYLWEVTYRKTPAHLKPYQPQYKKAEDEHSDNNMWNFKANHKQFDSVKSKNNQVQSDSRPKRDIKPPVQLDL